MKKPPLKNIILLSALCIALLCAFAIILHNTTKQKTASTPVLKVISPSPTKPPKTNIPAPTPQNSKKAIKLAAVGDIIVHDKQLENGYDSKTGIYNFSGYFKNIKKYIEETDFSLANLETTLAGKEREYTGWPAFNSPEVIAEVLKTTGFDILSTANNHCLDRNYSGLAATIDNLNKIGLLHMGTYKDSTAASNILFTDKNGIRTAFLSYTYGTNGYTLPKDKSYAVNYIDKTKMLSDIKSAKALKCDIIIFYLHFGTEYKASPDKDQKELVDFLFESGVDMVIGSHPHVLQPIEQKKVIMDGTEKNCYAAYSLGNFISKRREPDRASSAILQIEIEKDFTLNKTIIKKVSYIPTFVDMSLLNDGKYDFRVIAMENAIYDYEHKLDPMLNQEDYETIKTCYKRTLDLLGTEYLHKVR